MEIIFYLGSIVLANVAVHIFGMVTLFGLITFPAGAAIVGLTFTFRDLVQRKHGNAKCWIWMGVALIITVLFNPTLAVASGAAFLVSEFIDWLYFKLSGKPLWARVFWSNCLSAPVDSAIFVTLAFGWNLDAIMGQAMIKILFGALIFVLLAGFNRNLRPERIA